jgi:hypothetical protein
MIIYPDTSFILSLWHAGDVNYPAALEFFRKHETAGWIWCDLHEIEVPIAAQVATHRDRQPLKPHIARAIVARAERAARRGFQRKTLPEDVRAWLQHLCHL